MITINELFSGIGAQVEALKSLKIPYQVVGISEIDKYAIKSYEAINGVIHNYGNIKDVKALNYADLWTYSFPCQDISVAGLQRGLGAETRSGLLLQVERLLFDAVINGKAPKYLLLENVKNLVGKKFKSDFDKWLKKLESLGYNNYWQVLNAKDYGIPQNRERVFVVSIRKDVDTKGYKFPEKKALTRRLKDVLESEVAEKYYLSDEIVEKFGKALKEKIDNQAASYCIDANYAKGTTPDQFLNKSRRQLVSNAVRCGGRGSVDGKHTWDVVCVASRGRNPDNPSDRTTGSPTEQRLEPCKVEGCRNTLTTVQKDNYVIIDDPFGYEKEPREYSKYSPALRSERQGLKVVGISNHVNKPFEFNGFHNDLSPSLLATDYKNPKCYNNGFRIRKLTPLECWRLMGFPDEAFNKAKSAGVSDSQLYKQAGNSIVVDVLASIFKNMEMYLK